VDYLTKHPHLVPALLSARPLITEVLSDAKPCMEMRAIPALRMFFVRIYVSPTLVYPTVCALWAKLRQNKLFLPDLSFDTLSSQNLN
jgi:hypothetical protein